MSEEIGIRAQKTRVRKMQSLLTFTRVFAGLTALTAFILVVTSIDPVIWNFKSFWYGLKLLLFLFEMLFLLIGYGISYLFGLGGGGPAAVMTAIHIAIFGGNQTILGIPIEDFISNPLQIPSQQPLIDAIYAFFIMLAILIALIAGIGFLRECNPALSAVSFFSLNVVLGLASLNGKLLLDLSFSSTNFIQTIFSKLVITAFLLYFSLELSFQASYIYSVVGPNIERHRRINRNIERLKEYEMPVGPQKTIIEDESIAVKGDNTSESRFRVSAAFSQIRALVGKKLFRVTPEEDIDVMNNRLKNFYLRLEENDPMISVSLSASAYTPSVARLLVLIFVGTLLRMVILLVLSWVGLNPVPILDFLNVPESIVNSVEAGQHEMIIMLLLPLTLLFLLLGLLIQWIQKRVEIRLLKTKGPTVHPVSEIKESDSKQEGEEQLQAIS